MGVEDFSKIEYNGIKISQLEERFNEEDLVRLSGCTIYVDTSFLIHQSIHARKLKNSKGGDTGHYMGIIETLLTFAGYDIKLIWVIDPVNKTHFKSETIKKRQTKQPIIYSSEETELFLLSLGQTVMKCVNLEAEHYASILCRQNLSNSYVLTEDSDVLMYGANRISKRKGVFHILRINDILNAFGITYEMLLLVCIYLGNDYCSRIPLHGPKTIIKRIKGEKELGQLSERHLMVKDYVLSECEQPIIINGISNIETAINILIENGFSETARSIKSLRKYLLDS